MGRVSKRTPLESAARHSFNEACKSEMMELIKKYEDPKNVTRAHDSFDKESSMAVQSSIGRRASVEARNNKEEPEVAWRRMSSVDGTKGSTPAGSTPGSKQSHQGIRKGKANEGCFGGCFAAFRSKI